MGSLHIKMVFGHPYSIAQCWYQRLCQFKELKLVIFINKVCTQKVWLKLGSKIWLPASLSQHGLSHSLFSTATDAFNFPQYLLQFQLSFWKALMLMCASLLMRKIVSRAVWLIVQPLGTGPQFIARGAWLRETCWGSNILTRGCSSAKSEYSAWSWVRMKFNQNLGVVSTANRIVFGPFNRTPFVWLYCMHGNNQRAVLKPQLSAWIHSLFVFKDSTLQGVNRLKTSMAYLLDFNEVIDTDEFHEQWEKTNGSCYTDAAVRTKQVSYQVQPAVIYYVMLLTCIHEGKLCFELIFRNFFLFPTLFKMMFFAISYISIAFPMKQFRFKFILKVIV